MGRSKINKSRAALVASEDKSEWDNKITPGDPFGDFFIDYKNRINENGLLNKRQKQRIDLVGGIKSKGFYTFQQAFESKSGPLITLDGTEYKLLSSYDYLGLIGHKAIENAAIEAIQKFGSSSGGVRLLAGTNKLHFELEN